MKITREDAYKIAVKVIKTADVKDNIVSLKKVVYGFLDKDANIVSICIDDKFIDILFTGDECIVVQAIKYEWFWDVMLRYYDDDRNIVLNRCHVENLNKSREEIAYQLYKSAMAAKEAYNALLDARAGWNKDTIKFGERITFPKPVEDGDDSKES